jgi:tRNA nucleotidyltransferase (CCA-adding enzyme)
MEVITTHISSDFDALASMVAAKKYYPRATIVLPGSPEKSVRNFLAASPLSVEIRKLRDINLEEVTRLIIVDIKKPGRIGKFSTILGKKELSIHIFDHHPSSNNDIRGH